MLQQNKDKESEEGSGSSKDSKEEDNFQCLAEETDLEVDEILPIAPISPLDTSLADGVMEQNQELAMVSQASNYVAASSASTITTASQGDSVLFTVAPLIVKPARVASKSATTSRN